LCAAGEALEAKVEIATLGAFDSQAGDVLLAVVAVEAEVQLRNSGGDFVRHFGGKFQRHFGRNKIKLLFFFFYKTSQISRFDIFDFFAKDRKNQILVPPSSKIKRRRFCSVKFK
jgi:hypothetical protein